MLSALVRTHLKGLPVSDADEEKVTLSYPVILTSSHSLTTDLSFDKIDGDTNLLNLDVDHERTRILRVGVGFSSTSSRQTSAFAATVSRGLGFAGAHVEKTIGRSVFTKMTMAASIDRQIASKVVVRLRAAGQYSAKALASSELFVVGGHQFGRAFPESSAGGDCGYAGSLEVGWSPATLKDGHHIEFYTFADGAGVQSKARYPYPAAETALASTGLGMRLVGRTTNVELTLAKSLVEPYPGTGAGWRLTFGASMNFG